MAERGISFVLVHVDEAHSNAWPILGRPSLDPRNARAFVESDPYFAAAASTSSASTSSASTSSASTSSASTSSASTSSASTSPAFSVLVDSWANTFGNAFRAWPDKYYLLERGEDEDGRATYRVAAFSEYGSRRDAVIDTECTDLIRSLLHQEGSEEERERVRARTCMTGRYESDVM